MKEVLFIKRTKKSNQDYKITFDPRCFDNNLHIRLKKYKGDELISGFEQKLIFTIEYLLANFIKRFPSYSVDFKVKDDSEEVKNYIFSKYVNEFKQSHEYKMLKKDLGTVIDFTDIVIRPLYSKKEIYTKESQFGNILDFAETNTSENSLTYFISKYTDVKTIKAFLLDDSISLLLTDVDENVNEKYIAKNARKLTREIKKANGYKESQLW